MPPRIKVSEAMIVQAYGDNGEEPCEEAMDRFREFLGKRKFCYLTQRNIDKYSKLDQGEGIYDIMDLIVYARLTISLNDEGRTKHYVNGHYIHKDKAKE